MRPGRRDELDPRLPPGAGDLARRCGRPGPCPVRQRGPDRAEVQRDAAVLLRGPPEAAGTGVSPLSVRGVPGRPARPRVPRSVLLRPGARRAAPGFRADRPGYGGARGGPRATPRPPP